MKVFLVIGSVCAITVSLEGNAQMQTPFDRTRAEEAIVRQALISRKFAFLDERLNGLQKAYEEGRVGEDAIKDGFQAFGDTDDSGQQAALRDWVKAYPQSYAARLAYARQLMGSGLNSRGEDYASATPPERLRLMQELFEDAKRELRISMGLTSRPMYSFQTLMVIARSQGDRREARSILEEANKICPTNHAVRVQYQISLAPRWGGSYGQMDGFIQQAKKEGLDRNGIAELEGIKDWYKGKDDWDNSDDVNARKDFESALQIAAQVGGRFKQDYLLDALGYMCNVSGSGVYCSDPVLVDYFVKQRQKTR